MTGELIQPNWHVALLHLPLGLVFTGVLAEIFTAGRPAGGLRSAARWMIVLGALSAIPTAALGTYALRDTLLPEPASADKTWSEIASGSPWSAGQWNMMRQHIWYNAGAIALLALVAVAGLARVGTGRRPAYWPMLVMTLAASVLLALGAWHGGESVYQYATAVRTGHHGVESADGVKPAVLVANQSAEETPPADRERFSPLQLHILLGGLVIAAALAAIGLTVRAWQPPLVMSRTVVQRDVPVTATTPSGSVQTGRADTIVNERVPVSANRIRPGGFWLLAFVLGLGAAVAGGWSVMGRYTPDTIRANLHMMQQTDHARLLWHAILGVSILVLPLLLAMCVRFARRQHGLAGVLSFLVVVAAFGQVWLGTLMLFDSHAGPLTRFNSAPLQTSGERAGASAGPHVHSPAAVSDAGLPRR